MGIGNPSLQGFSLFSTLRWWNTTLEFDQSSGRQSFSRILRDSLVHLFLHERLGTLIPYFAVQNALRISHVVDQRSLNECLFVHNVCEDIPHLRDEFLLRGLFHMKVNNEGNLVCQPSP
jgi:hypothetical protein